MQYNLDYVKNKLRHAGFQKYFKNISLALSSKIFSLLVSFFIGLLMARYLGPQRYGVLNYILSFVGIFAFLSNFGIDNIIVRELVKFKDEREKIINTTFSLKIIGSILVICLILLSSLLIKNDSYTTTLIFLYSIQIIFASVTVLDFYFQSEVRYKNSFYAVVISTIAVSALKLLLIYGKFGTGWFVLALLFETLVGALVFLFLYKKENKILSPSLDIRIAKKLLSDSWPFLITTAFYLVYSRIDQVMVGRMIDTTSLGIYAAGVKLAEIWYFVPAIICGVVLPSLVSSRETSEDLYKKRATKLLLFVSGLSILFALFEFTFAKMLILITFGKDYLFAANVLQIYTWAGIFIAMIMALNQKLTVENRTKIIIISSFFGAAANIGFNLMLIPHFGIIGSAWATLISYAFVPLIIFTFHKFTKIN